MDEYMKNDIQLSNLRSNYAKLTADRDELVERYESMRLNTRNSYYYALALASRENSLKNVDWSIDSALSGIEARKASLELSYRRMLLDLYEKSVYADSATESSDKAQKSLEGATDNYDAGIVSRMDFLQTRYSAKAALNSKLSANRQFEKALRVFNMSLGRPIDNMAPEIAPDEEPLEMGHLEDYLDTALSCSTNIISLKQELDRLKTEKRYLDKYSLPTGFDYVANHLESLDINIELTSLRLEEALYEKKTFITNSYNSLLIDMEKLDLSKMDLNIQKEIYETNKKLNSMGYLDQDELAESYDNYEKALEKYSTDIYEFNTSVKQLEYDCAFYNREVYGK